LAAARGGDATGDFRIGDRSFTLDVPEFTGYVGQSQSLVVDGRIVPAASLDEPYIKDASVAWIGTHRHSASSPLPREVRSGDRSATPTQLASRGSKGSDEPYVFCYLFKYALD